MTTSGTYDYSLSSGEGVLAAFERIQIRVPSIRQEHMLTARRELNFLQAEWSNKQVNLWKVELISNTLTQGTATYAVPARVVMMLDAYVSLNYGTADQTDRYITPMSRTNYASIAAKSTQGFPTSYWYDRLSTAPTFTTWPVADGNGPYTLNYYACSQMQDASAYGSQTPDIPYLWTDAIVAGLAHRLARVYAPSLEQQRKADAMEAWMIAATQNVENVPVIISPGISRYYR